MDIRQLKYFLAVAETGSFTQASRSTYVSRQTISKAILNLENELGITLFVRNYDGVELTPEGSLAYNRICKIMKEIESLQHELLLMTAREM